MALMRPMRRTSLMGPYGIGAIVPFPNDESLMIAGLDMWKYDHPEDFVIRDDRLIKRLGVKELRWPPDYRERNADPKNYHITIPAVRFPTWYYCPFCGSMRKTSLYETQPECDAYPWEKGRKCSANNRQRKKMIPETFVVICPEGHIDDFPVAEWVHRNSGHYYDPASCRLRRSTGGISAGLSGVSYNCTCGAHKSLSGATQAGFLERMEYKCKGARPWLGQWRDEAAECCSDTNRLRVVLRGATNVWFSKTISSLFIPTLGDENDKKIVALVEEMFDTLNNTRVNGEFNRAVIDAIAAMKGVDAEKLYQAVLEKANAVEALPEVNENTTEEEYRLGEYKVLRQTSGSDSQDYYGINYPIERYSAVLKPYFKSITLVHKLKETRAFVGFSRLDCKEEKVSQSKKMLRLGEGNWLPATVTYGEGIFFEFDEEKLINWASDKDVMTRIAKMENSYKSSFSGQDFEGGLRPEFVLIHTFAHLIINQLSFECGYSSSALRERLYCEKRENNFHMCGVLIYTASGDSEGSLGGLVRQGLPGRIEDTIISALKNALWCTSDPVCIQSPGQGTDSCNLAACHNCALLPETCCEIGNRLLDRGVAIGTLDKQDIGFFSSIRNL